MDTYTMTFVNEGELGFPEDRSYPLVKRIILEQLTYRKLSLADFNWMGTYDATNVLSYFEAPYYRSTIIEIRMALYRDNLQSRESIVQCCRAILENDNFQVRVWDSALNKEMNVLQNHIVFAMPEVH